MPIPVKNRSRLSMLSDPTTAVSSEAIPKIARLASNSGRRPNRSPIGPAESAPTMMPMLDHRKAIANVDGGRCQSRISDGTAQTTEAALENQRLGGLQLRVAALCTLVQMCDGYDVNSVAWAVPSLIRDWQLPPSTFAIAFLWSSIGIMVGALSAGPIGDRFGRRPLLLASLTIFGIASLLTAVVGSLSMLSLLRFFTGIGIGGGFSGAAALTGDYTPHRLRATLIMATFTGAPLGGFLGGQIVALLLPHFGWQSIFILGGAFPLLLVPALALWLPESPRF